jgi:heme exporter protein A
MLIEAQSIACERGGRIVFENISFQLAAGTCIELHGANGSGKSTLLRMLAGFLDRTAGQLAMSGEAFYIGHADAVKPSLTVKENLAFWQSCFGGSVENALAAFYLEPLAHDPAAILSQGQKRRLALSRLALTARPIWLLDEPAAGLDSASRGQLAQLLETHVSRGGGVLAATHEDLGVRQSQRFNLDHRA